METDFEEGTTGKSAQKLETITMEEEEDNYIDDLPGCSKDMENQQLYSNKKDSEKFKTSEFESLMHLIKGMMGTGILAMPLAFKNAGIIFGPISLGLLAILCTHCMHMLLETSKILSNRLHCHSLSYQEVSEYVFRTGSPRMEAIAPWARGIVKFFLCLTQLGFCIVYMIFVAEHIKQVVEICDSSINIPKKAYIAMVLPFVLVYSFVKSLKRLAPASIIATILQLLGILITFQVFFKEFPPITDRVLIAPVKTWPLYFGTAMFAFEGIGVVLPIENKMKNPEAFPGWNGVLNTGMTLLGCAYISVGFYGYLHYGSAVDATVTTNLPYDKLYLAVRLMFSVALFLSIGLQYYVAHDIIFTLVKKKINLGHHEVKADYAVRVIMILLVFTMAEVMPYLDVAIALVGAVGSSSLAVIFPPIMHIIVLWPNNLGKYKWKMVKNILISLLGFTGFLTGTYSAIIDAISKEK